MNVVPFYCWCHVEFTIAPYDIVVMDRGLEVFKSHL